MAFRFMVQDVRLTLTKWSWLGGIQVTSHTCYGSRATIAYPSTRPSFNYFWYNADRRHLICGDKLVHLSIRDSLRNRRDGIDRYRGLVENGELVREGEGDVEGLRCHHLPKHVASHTHVPTQITSHAQVTAMSSCRVTTCRQVDRSGQARASG